MVPYGKDVGHLLGDSQEIDIVSFVSKNNSRIVKYNADELDSPENYTTEHEYGFKWAVLATVLGTVLLDFNADNSQTPARAYLLDVCLAEDHAKALSTFTIMAGIGGFLGYSLGGIDWSETQIGLLFGGNVKTVFAIVTIIFIISTICTLTSFREIPLPLMERDDLLRPVTHADLILEKERITKAHFSVKNVS
jgi:solute carrier family 45, member 1/2/4